MTLTSIITHFKSIIMIQLTIYDLHLLFMGDHFQFFVDYVPHYQWWSIDIRSIKLIFICISNLTISKPKSMVAYIFNEIIFTSINSKIWWDSVFICWKHWKNLCIDYTNKFMKLNRRFVKIEYLKAIIFFFNLTFWIQICVDVTWEEKTFKDDDMNFKENVKGFGIELSSWTP